MKKDASSEGVPVERLETDFSWDDLQITAASRQAIGEVAAWTVGTRLGTWVLFRGAAGTGKSLAASLLGRDAALPVYRIDLSTILSKYIGETEKNLDRLLERAATQGAILYLGEADSVFAKHGRPGTGNDRADNQQVAYLLQRLESYRGLVLFAAEEDEEFVDDLLSRCRAVIQFGPSSA